MRIKVNQYNIETIETERIIRGTVKKACEIKFDEYWIGFDVTVVFKRTDDIFKGKPLGYLFPNIQDDIEAEIPYEIMTESGFFKIGVYGSKSDGTVRPTLWSEPFEIEYGTDTSSEIPAEPTPSIYQQLIDLEQQAVDIAQSVRDDADAGLFKGEKGDQGLQGVQGEKGEKGDTYTITPADYNSIATIVKEDIVIPSKTSDLTNDSGFITNTVANLANYYLKTETYTKSEVQNLIGQISGLRLEKVNVLPQTGQTGIIYLVPNTSQEQRNVFDEYIWIDNDWELIGSTEIDLTGYATETWVTAQISDFLTESQITNLVNTALANYYTKGQVDALLDDKADSSALTGYVSKTTTIAGVDLQDNISKSELLTALNVEDGAEINDIASISLGGTNLLPDANKNVNIPIVTLTQAQYDALVTKDAGTYYCIIEV